MGLVYARWGHLADQPFRLLTFMAYRSRDDDDPPTFWEGRDAAAFALGRNPLPEPAAADATIRAEEIRRLRRNDFQVVKRVLGQLIQAGAVTVCRHSARGRSATYALTLSGAAQDATGYTSRTEQGTRDVPTGYTSRTEQGTRDVPLNKKEEKYITSTLNSTESGTSPTRDPGNESPNDSPELDYGEASAILQKLQDLGAGYLERVAAVDGLSNRVVAAALLARADQEKESTVKGRRSS